MKQLLAFWNVTKTLEGYILQVEDGKAPWRRYGKSAYQGEVAVIVPELTGISWHGLSDRFLTMSISIPVDTLCRDVVDLMVSSKQSDIPNLLGEYFLEPQIYLPD